MEKPLDVAVVPITENELPFAMKVAGELRNKGEKTTIVATNKRLGDKLNYAAKLAKSAIVLGENEVKTGEYAIKHFE